MPTADHNATAYWTTMLDHDLTLFLDDRGRLWRFRSAQPAGRAVPEARLEEGELVITRPLADGREEVAVRLVGHDLDLCCGRGGDEISRDRVALPPGVDLDVAHMRATHQGGVVEVRLPLARPAPACSKTTSGRVAA